MAGIEDWIDNLAELWSELKYDGESLTTYKVWGRDEFPGELAMPCAVVFVEADMGDYSASEGSWGWYEVTIEFHLHPIVDRKKIPGLIPLFDEIKKIAAKNMALGCQGVVFMLNADAQGRILLRGLEWGDEEEHLGLLARGLVYQEIPGMQVSLAP